MSEDTRPEESGENPAPTTPAAPIDHSQWPRRWAQLEFFTFQPAISLRMKEHVSSIAVYRLLLASNSA